MWIILFSINAIAAALNIHSKSYGLAMFSALMAIYCALHATKE